MTLAKSPSLGLSLLFYNMGMVVARAASVYWYFLESSPGKWMLHPIHNDPVKQIVLFSPIPRWGH